MTAVGSTPPPIPSGHALIRFVEDLETLLDSAGAANAWTMTSSELRSVLPRLTRAKARLAEVELRVLREADRHSVGDDVGAANTAAWWAHLTGQRVPAAQRLVTLAGKLDDDIHAATRAALATGRVQVDQAQVILDAVEALPSALVGPDLVADAEAHLIGLADLDGTTRFDPRALRVAGRKILEVVAPEVAEAHEARQLEAEEHLAAAAAMLTMRPDGHGSMLGRFKVPMLHGAMLTRHLDAIAAPRHQHATGGSTTDPDGHRVAKPLRWGQAFVEYLETRSTTGLPNAGGVPATVVVTMTLENLLNGVHGSELPAALDTGEVISAAQARRLACEAGIIPAVLATRSQPLDLGRKARFHTPAQRVAIMLRDGGCAAIGCDWPPGMCHVHHRTPWSRGGATSVADGIMLCPRHHTLAHDARYQLKTDKHGKVTFARRT
ncbi:hypothetical protein ACVW00_002274 [Marmoricola sp. URHA0025 HA25]